MGYSRSAGSYEGAILIFANNSKEAKRLASQSNVISELADGFLDVAVTWLKNQPFLFKQMPTDDTPCFVESPVTCTTCKMWGMGDIGEDGVCEACKEIAPSSNNLMNLTSSNFASYQNVRRTGKQGNCVTMTVSKRKENAY